MSDIRIQLDFEIPPELIEVVRRSTECEFLGYDKPLTRRETEDMLKEYVTTKRKASFERMSLMKIWKGDTLVGYAYPRKVADRERHGFKIPMNDDPWYRLGTIFILPEYRKGRITTEVVAQFHSMYSNLVWQCEEDNHASAKSAECAGFKYSHHLYFRDNDGWSFEKDREFIWGYKVLKVDGDLYQ